MKILILTERLPSRIGGGVARVLNIIIELSKENEITLLTPAYPWDAPYLNDLKPYCQAVSIIELPEPLKEIHSIWYWRLNAWMHTLFSIRPRPWQPVYLQELRLRTAAFLRDHNFDLILINHAYLCEAVPPGARPVKILDTHNILSSAYERDLNQSSKATAKMQAWTEWKKVRRFEKIALSQCQHAWVVSEEDRQELLKLSPKTSAKIVPNGVDTTYFQPASGEPEDISLLFAGSMSYPPNVEGVLYFYRQILPLVASKIDRLNLFIVGWQPTPEIMALQADPRVTITGMVDDVRPYFYRSKVFIVPILSGGGTRLKILDAWACAKPVVSTTFGAQGLAVTHDENISIADDPTQFADSVIQLLGSAEDRLRLGQSGRATAEKLYSWARIGQDVRQFLANVRVD